MYIRSAKETEVQEGGGILQAGDMVNLRFGACFVLNRMCLTKEGLDSPTESTF